MRIVLHGYYGFGNFGDDLLCKVSLGFFETNFPEASIAVLTYAKQPDYIRKLAKRDVEILSASADVKTDVFYIGGGGLYFDFVEGGRIDRFLNRTLKLIPGKHYLAIMRLLGRTTDARKKIAMGIGIGSFTESSRKFRYKLLQLLELDRIYVRDEASVQHLKYLTGQKAIRTTDLAFATSYWVPQGLEIRNSSKRVLFILRDWKSDGSAYLESAFSWLRFLQEQGYDCQVASFDVDHDRELIHRCHSDNIKLLAWDPRKQSFDDYVRMLNAFDIFISSRAHGVLSGLLLNKRSMAVIIEPKLGEIRKMAPQSIGEIPKQCDTHEFFQRFTAFLDQHDLEKQKRELAENEGLIMKSLNEIVSFLK